MTSRDPRWRSLLWRFAGRPLFRCTFHNWYRYRQKLLCMFGATITGRTKFRRSVRIDRPWNICARNLAIFGDDVIVRAAAPIEVGQRTVISQYTILSSEVRDPKNNRCAPTAAPITIGDDCWIAADSLVLPGANVGNGTVVGARALVRGTLPEWSIATGEPARVRGERIMRSED